FDGDLPDESSTFGFTFKESGTFNYFCQVHPSMVGKIIVR
ncbi:MAG: Cupredoxin-like domain, partial [Actinomycetota bacterium]|nr:Cupredoxin-like domain [Actinomycetota bacterium]